MRLTIVARDRNEEVIAEPFAIRGTVEKFAVHHALSEDVLFGAWVATHIDTGFAVARANTIDGAIESARHAWNAITPEQLADRLVAAREECARRLADGRGAQ